MVPYRKLAYGLAVALLLVIHCLFAVSTIRSTSITYDEPQHVAGGYALLATGNYAVNTHHPPFPRIWEALPLFLSDRSLNVRTSRYWPEGKILREVSVADGFPFGNDFLFFNNSIDAAGAVNSARYMTLVLSVVLGVLMFLWSRELFGAGAGLASLFLWSFGSFFIAHGTLATTDMAPTLFYFAVFYLLWKLFNREGGETTARALVKAAALGAATALALCSKHSTLVLAPVAAAIAVWEYRGRRPVTSSWSRDALMWGTAGITTLAVMLLVYRFNSLREYYWGGIQITLSVLNEGNPSFFMGKHVKTRLYFPATFLLKTPIALLILSFATLFCRKLWSARAAIYLLAPPLAYFFLSLSSNMQIGHRHILPLYPFMIVWASGLYPHLRTMATKGACAALLGWYALGTLIVHPWHLGYFNEFAGSGKTVHNYLVDSNLDWGQGLIALRDYLNKNGIRYAYLSYFGTDDPHRYGIRYTAVGCPDDAYAPYCLNDDSKGPLAFVAAAEKRVIFAVSATFLHGVYFRDTDYFSLVRDIPYEAMVGNSLFVYDLGKYPEKLKQFNELLQKHQAFKMKLMGSDDSAAPSGVVR